MRRKRRRQFGYVCRLPSGRFQASYLVDGKRHNAPTTFLNRTDAETFLTLTEGQIIDSAVSPRRYGPEGLLLPINDGSQSTVTTE